MRLFPALHTSRASFLSFPLMHYNPAPNAISHSVPPRWQILTIQTTNWYLDAFNQQSFARQMSQKSQKRQSRHESWGDCKRNTRFLRYALAYRQIAMWGRRLTQWMTRAQLWLLRVLGGKLISNAVEKLDV